MELKIGTQMKIKKECLVCGKKAVINVDDETRKYDKWHYFGEVELPVGEGENVKVGEYDLLGRTIDVVEWTGKKEKVEYWECDKCYEE